MSLLPFAQLDLAGRLGLADGRYLVSAAGQPDASQTAAGRPAGDVLALRTLGAPRASSRLRRGRPRPVEDDAASPLPLTRVTFVKGAPFDSTERAADWLDQVSADGALAEALIGEATRALNRAILAYRIAAPDPYARERDPGEAVAVRLGFGTGDQLADGHWSEARELPPERRRSPRSELIDGVGATERVAAVLGGRDSVTPVEELAVAAELAFHEQRLPAALAIAGAAVELLGPGRSGPAGELAARLRAAGDPSREAVRELLAALREALRR